MTRFSNQINPISCSNPISLYFANTFIDINGTKADIQLSQTFVTAAGLKVERINQDNIQMKQKLAELNPPSFFLNILQKVFPFLYPTEPNDSLPYDIFPGGIKSDKAFIEYNGQRFDVHCQRYEDPCKPLKYKAESLQYVKNTFAFLEENLKKSFCFADQGEELWEMQNLLRRVKWTGSKDFEKVYWEYGYTYPFIGIINFDKYFVKCFTENDLNSLLFNTQSTTYSETNNTCHLKNTTQPSLITSHDQCAHLNHEEGWLQQTFLDFPFLEEDFKTCLETRYAESIEANNTCYLNNPFQPSFIYADINI